MTLRGLFYPSSAVVVGVSDSKTNLGKNILKNFIEFGFKGPLYAVGPNGGTVHGKEVYQSVLDLPENVEFAAILVPARAVPETLEHCGKKGVRYGAIMTAGFSEYGPERQELEDQVLATASKYGIQFVGPNCLGIISMDSGICAPFVEMKPDSIIKGGAAVLSQSGAVGQSIVGYVSRTGVGLNKFVSMGNKLILDEADYLSYFVEEDETSVICVYLEGVKRGREFFDVARQSRKPILIHKSNTTSAGSRIAKSHTGSLASDDKIVSAAYKQAGIIRVDDVEKMGDYANALRLPELKGNRLAVMHQSGGFSVVMADLAERFGFVLPVVDQNLLSEIEEKGRAGVIKMTNPLDLGDTPDRGVFMMAAEKLMDLPYIDALILPLSVRGLNDGNLNAEKALEAALAQIKTLIGLSESRQKPIAIISQGADSQRSELNALRRSVNYPLFNGIRDAVQALSIRWEYSKLQKNRDLNYRKFDIDQSQAKDVFREALAKGQFELGSEAIAVLGSYGIPMALPEVANDIETAQSIANSLGYPVVMKIQSPDILHKSDVGGVRLGIQTKDELASAFNEILATAKSLAPEARIQGVTVQKMVEGGTEVILGIKRDDQFGPVIMFGLGGVFVELFEDVSFRLAPISEEEAFQLVEEVRASRLLKGFRGAPTADTRALVDCLLRLSQFAVDFPQVTEVDINPLKVFPEGKGCLGVDARIMLEPLRD